MVFQRITPNDVKNMLKVAMVVATILVIWTFLSAVPISCSSSSSSDETNAKVCAKKAVEDELLSPSTADFCSYTSMTATSLGGNDWKITGYVDAQNAYGATIRKNWTVTLTLTKSGFKNATVTFN